MKKLLNIRSLIGIILIVVALLPPLGKPQNDTILLDINKPSDQVIEIVKPISDLITDPTDRAKLAIFNQEFANRVISYDTDIQKLNDVYALAGSNFFKDTLVNKYEKLDSSLVDLVKKICTDDNHILTQEEKNQLSSHFMGLAWSLIQKR